MPNLNLTNAEYELDAVLNAPQLDDLTLTDGNTTGKKKGKTYNTEAAADLSVLAGKSDTKAGSQDFIKAPVEDDPEWEVLPTLWGGMETSMVGTAVRTGLETGSVLSGVNQMMPSLGEDYELDGDDQNDWVNSGLPVEVFSSVMRNTKTKEEFQAKLKLVKENREFDMKTAESGLMAGIVGGVGDAIGDPTSYIPVAGWLGKGAKAINATNKIINSKLTHNLVSAGATAYASEKYLRNQITGKDAHVAEAVVGSLAFAGILHGAGQVFKSATSARIEASETARNTNSQDPTVLRNHDGSAKLMDDGEGGQIEVTESGKVVTAGLVPPKSARSGRFWYQDLATKANNAESPETRELAAMFSRPTQGYRDEFVAEAPTADQIKRSMDNRTNDLLTDLQDVLDELVDHGKVLGGGAGQRADFGKRIAHAIQGYPLDRPLSDLESKAAARIQQHLREYADYMADPSRLSGVNAPSLHSSFIDDGSYIPRVYNRAKLNRMRSDWGDDAMVKAVADSWDNAYKGASDKTRLDEAILSEYPDQTVVTPEMVRDYANRKAYGVVKGEDGVFNTDIFSDGASISGARTPNYLKGRVPLSTMGDAVLPDGTPFRLDDIVDYNLENTLGGYFRNVSGHVSLAASTGKTLDELAEAVAKLPDVSKADKQAKQALTEQLKVFTGKARTDYTMLDLLSDSLRDATYSVTNALMWVGNMAEIGTNMFSNPKVTGVALKNLSKALGRDVKEIAGMSNKEIEKTFSDMVSGSVKARRMNLTYADWAEGLAGRMGTRLEDEGMLFKAASRVRYGAMKASQASPFTGLLNRTQEAIVKAGNEVGLGELIAHANGNGKTSLVDPKFLKANGIDQSVADRALAYLREWEASDKRVIGDDDDFNPYHDAADELDGSGFERWDDEQYGSSTLSAEGKADRDWWLSDPRSADVERLLQAFNDELIMKTDGVGQQYYTPLGAGGRLLMQFKRFATVSTQYAVKTSKDIAEHARYDRLLVVLGGFTMAGLYHVGTTSYKSMYMEGSERKKYLEEHLSPMNITVGALKRTPLLAGWGLGYDMANVVSPIPLPYAGYGKTTFENFMEQDAKPTSTAGVLQSKTNAVLGMVPAARTAANVGAAGYNAGILAWDNLVDDSTLRYSEESRAQRQMAKSFQSFIPNSPALRAGYSKIMEQWGIDMSKK